MLTGMLWVDDSQALLSVKIEQAAGYFHKKYGILPNLCLIHPNMLDESERKPFKFGELTVRPYRNLPSEHIWIGVEDRD